MKSMRLYSLLIRCKKWSIKWVHLKLLMIKLGSLSHSKKKKTNNVILSLISTLTAVISLHLNMELDCNNYSSIQTDCYHNDIFANIPNNNASLPLVLLLRISMIYCSSKTFYNLNHHKKILTHKKNECCNKDLPLLRKLVRASSDSKQGFKSTILTGTERISRRSMRKYPPKSICSTLKLSCTRRIAPARNRTVGAGYHSTCLGQRSRYQRINKEEHNRTNWNSLRLNNPFQEYSSHILLHNTLHQANQHSQS